MAVIEVVAVFALFYGGCVSQVITNPPQNATIREGEDTTFTCTAEENGMALTIPYGWRFTPSGPSSEVPLDNGTTLTGIEMVTVSGGLRTTLTFSGVQRDANGGTVTCIATGSIDSASASGILNVQSVSKVIITNAPQKAAVAEGDDTTFNCTAENNGSSGTVGWRFTPSRASSEVSLATGTTLIGVEMVTVSNGLRTMLTFSGVWREVKGGAVSCVVTTDRSNPANHTVQWPPTVNSGESITLQVGDSYPSVSINFTEGNPRSSMTITGPSQPGNPRVSISSDGVVNINGVSRDDAGTHTATWRNDAGSATFTLDLDVNGGGPKGLSAGAIAAMVVCSLVFMLWETE